MSSPTHDVHRPPDHNGPRRRRLLALLASVGFAGLTSVGAQTPAVFPTIAVRAPVAPRPLRAGGATHLVYELHITNLSARQTTVTQVEAHDDRVPAQALAVLNGTTLDTATRRMGGPADDAEPRVLPAGRTAIVFMWLTLPSGRPAPARLTHRISTQPRWTRRSRPSR